MMGKLVISLDGVVIKEVPITQEKTTLGRRPYNDIVIDNLAVSGEHATVHFDGHEVRIEDLNSTNGTFLNGKAIKRQTLVHNDLIEVGKYRLRYVFNETPDFEKTMIIKSGELPPVGSGYGAPPLASSFTGVGEPLPVLSLRQPPSGGPSPVQDHLLTPSTHTPSWNAPPSPVTPFNNAPASIKVLNGTAGGREVQLTKVVTTMGKPGVQVASITRRPTGYVFAHVEGAQRPMVNGNVLTGESVQLKSGDVIELAGTQMQFLQN
jgi:pSer/pThr/pTyr-binding forkhead associated (FHA) protein